MKVLVADGVTKKSIDILAEDFEVVVKDKLPAEELLAIIPEFDAIIAAVSSGKADFGAAGITVTEDRKKNIDFTDTYTKACQVIVVRNK